MYRTNPPSLSLPRKIRKAPDTTAVTMSAIIAVARVSAVGSPSMNTNIPLTMAANTGASPLLGPEITPLKSLNNVAPNPVIRVPSNSTTMPGARKSGEVFVKISAATEIATVTFITATRTPARTLEIILSFCIIVFLWETYRMMRSVHESPRCLLPIAETD